MRRVQRVNIADFHYTVDKDTKGYDEVFYYHLITKSKSKKFLFFSLPLLFVMIFGGCNYHKKDDVASKKYIK